MHTPSVFNLVIAGCFFSLHVQAGVLIESLTKPTENLAVDNLVGGSDLADPTQWTPTGISKVGQTFQVDTGFLLDSVVIQLDSARDFSSGTHAFRMVILEDTDAGSDPTKGDLSISDELYDISGMILGTKSFLTLDLDTNVSISPDTVYQWELWWSASDTANSVFLVSSAGDNIDNGFALWTSASSTTFPLGESFPGQPWDIDYALISAIPEPGTVGMAAAMCLGLLALDRRRRRR